MFNQFFGEEGAKRVSKWAASVLFFLSIFLVVKIIADLKKLPDVGNEVYPQSTIMVSGSGEAYAVPDIATFSFSATETGSTVKQAQEKADLKINKALTVIRELGVENKDIKTTSYNVYPKYEWSNAVCPGIDKPESVAAVAGGSAGVSSVSAIYCPPGKQVLTGYEVSQSVVVKVRDTEKVGDLVTKVGATGVSNISGVEFSVDNRDQYIAQARAEAIAEAKAKAKELAKQLGVRLGRILYYNENGNYPIYYGAEGKGGSADMMTSSIAPRTAELPSGETKITSDISITYEIK
jgi:hypothetical protein